MPADGVNIAPTLTSAEVNELLDRALPTIRKDRKGRYNEYSLFRDVMGDTPEMRAAFSMFLHDVKSCPCEVVEFCQKALAVA